IGRRHLLRLASDRTIDAIAGSQSPPAPASTAARSGRAAGRRRRCQRARPHLRGTCSQSQMDCRLHLRVDGGRLALRRCGDRSVLTTSGGWSMSAAMTAQFVTDALVMAIWRRGKPDALLHHSDRGSQYTSEQFQRLLADHGVACSMSRSGNVWDNAAMESFFSSLKTERTARKIYRTREDAKADVFDYIECFYNPKRRHSTIGYMSPMEFERQAGLA